MSSKIKFVDLGLSVNWADRDLDSTYAYNKIPSPNRNNVLYRLPTKEECEELIKRCKWKYIKGAGYWVYGKNKNKVFLANKANATDFESRNKGFDGLLHKVKSTLIMHGN